MTMTASKKNLQACQDQFFAAHCEAHELLEKIAAYLGGLPAPLEDSTNWGTVGTLQHVVAQLREISDHIDTIKR